MPTYFARKAGNINASDVWATTPSGTASAVTFVAGDVLMANSFAITVNVSTNLGALGEVRTDNANSATAGGGFTLSNGVTLTANCIAGTTPCVIFSGTSGNSASIVGNVTAGTGAACHGVNNANTGTLNINGNIFGGTTNTGASGTAGVNNSAAGTISITGTVTGGAGVNSNFTGVNNSAAGTISITGTVTGGGNSSAFGANNSSTGTLLIDGIIQASEFTAGVGGTNRQQVTLLTGPFLISPTFGVNPIGCTAWRWASALNNQTYIEVGTQTLLQKRNLVTPDNATNFPAASNVRSGTAYGIGGVVTGTCVVPNPAQVAAGTPVDNTVGTLASQTAEQIATAVWSATTRTITGGTVDTATTLTNAPTVPSVVQIRQEMDSNSTQLSAIKSKTDNLPSDPADQSLVEAAISALSIPSVVQIRTEMDSNSTKLANLDASVSSRLAGSAYTAPANSDITAIKAKTDNIPASPAAVSDIPTTAQISAAVEGSLLNEADGQAVLNAIVGAIGNTNLSEVSLVAAVRADLERTGGKLINLDAAISSRLAAADYSAPTSAPTAASVANAVWSAATKEITGGTVTTLTNSPDVPTEAEIASQVRTELSVELGRIDAAISSRLAPSGTLATVTNLTNAPASVTPSDIWSHSSRTLTSASGPTAVEIRQEIDANSTKLDVAVGTRLASSAYTAPANSDVAAIKVKTDALVVERLNNCATTAIVGNLLAQANS